MAIVQGLRAIATYSFGTVSREIHAVSVRWALFQIILIVSGRLAGVWAAELRSSSRRIFNENVAVWPCF